MNTDSMKYTVPAQEPPSYAGGQTAPVANFHSGLIPVDAEHGVPYNNQSPVGFQPNNPYPYKIDGPGYQQPYGGGVPPPMNNMPVPVAPSTAPIQGHPPETEKSKGWVVPRRWLVFIIAVAVIAVIVAIVVPVVIVVTRKDSNEPQITNSATPSGGNQSNGQTPRTTSSPSSTPSSTTTISFSPATITSTSSSFTLPLGYNTMIVSNLYTSGHSSLCYYQWWQVPYTYTLYPSITGNYRSSYTAYWTISSMSAYDYSLSTVGTIRPTETPATWTFQESVSFTYGSCSMGGYETIELGEDGTASYISEIYVDESSCTFDSTDYEYLDTCYLSWEGTWSE
ncbi:hypothetical protein ABW19_dt0203458 [Dactylella cylindrospora]|nr:hypothetical protein ABW19_dt0203458 [Dactylella cylindrospora]